ncbi:MAG: signal peptidase II [Cyclobacteriaceae bacterium]
MKIKSSFRALVILIVLSSNIGCDQVSKNIVRQRIEYNEEILLCNNFLTITKVENSGAFLSLGNSLPKPVRILLLTLLPIAFLGLALFYLFTKKGLSGIAVMGICFVAGGGIGNVYDRIIYGSVTDFLHMDFVIFQTGIFNMADVSIMSGTFMLLLDSFFNWPRSLHNSLS